VRDRFRAGAELGPPLHRHLGRQCGKRSPDLWNVSLSFVSATAQHIREVSLVFFEKERLI
jgi:hypothetical protein